MPLLLVFILRGIGAVSAVVLALVVSRFLRADEAAEFFLLSTLALVLSIAMRWGVDDLIVRHIATSADRINSAIQCLTSAHIRVLKGGVVGGLLVLGSSQFVPASSEIHLLIAFHGACMQALSASVGRVLQGLDRQAASLFALVIATPCMLILGIVVLYAFDLLTVERALCMYAMSATAAYALALGFLPPQVRSTLSLRKLSGGADQNTLQGANRLGIAVVAQQSSSWLILTAPAYLFDAQTYSAVVIAQKLASLVSFPAVVLNFSMATRIARDQCSGGQPRAYASVLRVVSSVGALSVCALAVVLGLGPAVMTLAGRSLSFEMLFVLALTQVFAALCVALTTVLVMRKREGFLSIAYMGCTLASAASLLLTAKYFAPHVALMSWALWTLVLFATLLAAVLSRGRDQITIDVSHGDNQIQ